jgi:hypothetical protein
MISLSLLHPPRQIQTKQEALTIAPLPHRHETMRASSKGGVFLLIQEPRIPACSHFAGPKTSRLTIIKRQAILSTPYALRRLIPSHQHVLVDREI